MLKLIKEKMLVSLVIVMLLVMVCGSVHSLATVIKPASTSNTNTANTVDNTVGATDTNTSKNTNNTSNTNKANAISSSVNSISNKTTYSNTNKAASKLPYAGSNTSMIFVVVALAVSAVYAYKKVSDYNI